MNVAPKRTEGERVAGERVVDPDVPILVRRRAPVLLAVEGLTKRYRAGEAAAVEGVSFTVAEGELMALLGPSGCGKTTTLRMIGGFETPDAGTIRLGERDITGLPPEKRGIGFVFQDYALFPHLTVLENVRFGLRGRPKAEAQARARGDAGGGRASPISPGGGRTSSRAGSSSGWRWPDAGGGAAAGAARRAVLEPRRGDAGRDAPGGAGDAEAVGLLGILVTHDQEEALALADRIAVMEGGRIRQVGTPAQIYREPVSEFVASFIGRSNIVQGHAVGGSAETIFGNLELLREAAGSVSLAVGPSRSRSARSRRARGWWSAASSAGTTSSTGSGRATGRSSRSPGRCRSSTSGRGCGSRSATAWCRSAGELGRGRRHSHLSRHRRPRVRAPVAAQRHEECERCAHRPPGARPGPSPTTTPSTRTGTPIPTPSMTAGTASPSG
jgi:iron(III) transport system ATP-binding protein